MEPYEYKTLFDFESSYWWYRGLRAILLDTLKGLGLGASSRILDAGCGTGKNLQELQGSITAYSFGFDLSQHAARYWPQRGLNGVCLASINQIPFRDGAFDGALSVDVLECDGVREEEAYRELLRVVRPAGFVVLVVPAYSWLYAEKHHKAVHASRRYTRRQVTSLLTKGPVRVLRITHLFPSLLPAIAGYRLLQRLSDHDGAEYPRSDLRLLPSLLNGALFRIVDVERRLLGRVDFPFGSSLLAVVQKQEL